MMYSAEVKLFKRIYLMNKEEIESKYTRLGEGAGRIIYAIDEKYVIKLSKNTGGDRQCELENYIYNHADKHLKKYLCPVVWYKNDMLIMHRAVPLAKTRREKNRNIFKSLKANVEDDIYKSVQKLVKTYDLLYGDVKSLSSWGTLNEQPVLIDYGCTREIFRKYFK